ARIPARDVVQQPEPAGPGRVALDLAGQLDEGALERVASHYGIPAERVCAIGDAPNDAGMLRWAGLGCAVANAFDEVQDAADVVLEHTNDQWAVGRAIERYVLGDDPVARQVALAVPSA
ncbi:MAG: HAD family hydrolase, partial [Phycisphaeraceae bacterium]